MINSKPQTENRITKTKLILLNNPDELQERKKVPSRSKIIPNKKDSTQKLNNRTINNHDNHNTTINKEERLKKEDNKLILDENKQNSKDNSKICVNKNDSLDIYGANIIETNNFNGHQLKIKTLDQQFNTFHKENKKLKKELQTIIESIGKSIEISSKELNKRDLLNHSDLSKLNQSVQLKERELNNQKMNLSLLKKQYDLIENKSNDKKGIEKITELEENILKIRNENEDLIKKVRILKTRQSSQSRELEVYNKDKEYPAKINILTEEIKNLVSKKHDYHNKITGNKRSLENLRTFLENVKTLYNKYKLINPLDEISSKEVESCFKVLQNELEGNEEEIFNKINSNIVVIRDLFPNRKKERKLRNDEQEKFNKDASPEAKAQLSPRGVIFPKIPERPRLKSMNKQRGKENEIGIFNKYEYFNTKGKSPIKKEKPETSHGKTSKLMQNIKLIVNKEEKKTINDEEIELELVLNCDYENTSNENYLILCNKKEQLDKMNKIILKNTKENEKIYEKKIKESEKTLETNRNRLKLIQDENELINQEIAELEKLIQLNTEEINIKAEVKIEESKLIKDSNNVSQTRNEILQDLKIIKSEEDKINDQKIDNKVIIENNEVESNKEVSNEKDKNHKVLEGDEYEKSEEVEKGLEGNEDSEVEVYQNNDGVTDLKKNNEKDIKHDDGCYVNLQPENTSNLVLNNIDI